MIPVRFALVGAAGFVAPRHLAAIEGVGGVLVAALDPHDSVGVLDRYFPEARFFTEPERFDRFLERLRQHGEPVDYLSICSPNYLHDAHVRMALRVRAHAICEKPLVISPWNLDPLERLEQETGRRAYTVLQLRLSEPMQALKRRLEEHRGERHRVALTYLTPRGPWYDVSWKGTAEKSGGLAMNIGIHFFDLLLWLFGPVSESRLHLREERRMAGRLELERASVQWFLSVAREDLPVGNDAACRSMTVDGEAVDLSNGFEELHLRVYREILAGQGLGIAAARPAIELVHRLRTCRLEE